MLEIPTALDGRTGVLAPVVRAGRAVRNAVRFVRSDNELLLYASILSFVLLLGVFGPMLAPYQYNEPQYGPDGQFLRTEGPSVAHPLGTTTSGYDVLSRLMVGARPTVITGLLGGSMIILLGSAVGVTAGWVGGWVGNLLMRITDFVYSVPLIPFAIVLLAFLGFGLFTTIIAMGLILWRGSARVLRSQVLQIKERSFILAARATGMNDRTLVREHVLPNIAPMMILFFALGIGYSILVQASLAFIGVSNPFLPSWGVMIRNVYDAGYTEIAWWWSLSPGFLISITVLSAFMFGRKYEEIAGGEADEQAFAGGA
jgi:peptide/nickel transport system permease protein